MAEESKKLQIAVKTEMIAKAEERAATLGITLNQYIIFLVAKDLDEYQKRVKKD
jgi:predicted HicB family RNase H-like nuclease